MKYYTSVFVLLVLALCFSGAALAHRVNVFAYVDGEAVQVECYFTRSQKVRQGKLTVSDLATGEELLQGVTDDEGLFRFRPAADFLQTGHGLNIVLNAGEGHRNDWQIFAEELAALAPAGAAPRPAPSAPANQAAPLAPTEQTEAADAPASQGEAAAVTLNAAELEALLGKMLDARLAPIRQSLARQAESGPGLRDIIGGLGWIIGLLGLAAYMKYRR